MIRHCDRCDTKEERIAELEVAIELMSERHKEELKKVKEERDEMRKERNSAVSECSDLMNELRKVKEELEDELKEAKNNYERYRHLSKRYQKRCGEKSRELWDTREELKKVKKECINPDDIDWDFLTKIIDMDKKWSPDLLLTLFINYISLSKNVQYFKTKAGGE